MDDDYWTITREALDGRTPPATLIRLRGEFDIDTRDELRNALLDVIDSGSTSLLIVDLDKVAFMDSEAIGAVLDGVVAAEDAGVDLRLRNAQGVVARVFAVIGMLHLFDPR